jgi:hypothetical protein
MATRYAQFTCDLYILLIYRLFVLFAMLMLTHIAGAEEDPYLSAISSEAKKVESSKAANGNDAGEIETTDGPSLQASEDDHKARCIGSYTLHKNYRGAPVMRYSRSSGPEHPAMRFERRSWIVSSIDSHHAGTMIANAKFRI